MTVPEIIEIGLMGPQGTPGTDAVDLIEAVTTLVYRSEELSDTTGFAPLPSTTINPANEVQQITVDASAGVYVLRYGIDGTPSSLTVPFDDDGTELLNVLTGLVELDVVLNGSVSTSVEVTGGPGGPGGVTPYLITFGGSDGEALNLLQIYADGAGLLEGYVQVSEWSTLSPMGLTYRSGRIYETDTNQSKIQKWDEDGNLVIEWGSYGSGDNQMIYPLGIDTDPSGNVYVADTNNHRVMKFQSDGTQISVWGWAVDAVNTNDYVVVASGSTSGTYGSNAGQLYNPQDIAVGLNGDVYVVDGSNHRVNKYDSDGAFLLTWGSGQGGGNGQFSYPTNIAVDSTGNVYVSGDQYDRIQKFDSSGNYLTSWSEVGRYPKYMTFDAADNLYFTDYNNSNMVKLDSDLNYLTFWGHYGASGAGGFQGPTGIAIDGDDFVYVGDNVQGRIQKFEVYTGGTPTVSTTTLVGGQDTDLGLFKLPLDVDFYANEFFLPVDTELGEATGTDQDNIRIMLLGREPGHEATWIGHLRRWSTVGEWMSFTPMSTEYNGDGSATWDWYATNAGGKSSLCFLRDDAGQFGYYYSGIDATTQAEGFYPYNTADADADYPVGSFEVSMNLAPATLRPGDYARVYVYPWDNVAGYITLQGTCQVDTGSTYGGVSAYGYAVIRNEGGVPAEEVAAWNAAADLGEYISCFITFWRHGEEGTLFVNSDQSDAAISVPQHGISANDVYLTKDNTDYFFGGPLDVTSVLYVLQRQINQKISSTQLHGLLAQDFVDAWATIRRSLYLELDNVNDPRYALSANDYEQWRIVNGGTNLDNQGRPTERKVYNPVDTYTHRPSVHPNQMPTGAVSMYTGGGWLTTLTAGDILEFSVNLQHSFNTQYYVRAYYYLQPGAGIEDEVQVTLDGLPYIYYSNTFSARGTYTNELEYFETSLPASSFALSQTGRHWVGFKTLNGLPFWLAGFGLWAYNPSPAIYESEMYD